MHWLNAINTLAWPFGFDAPPQAATARTHASAADVVSTPVSAQIRMPAAESCGAALGTRADRERREIASMR